NGFFADRRDFARESMTRGGIWARQRQVEAVQRGICGGRLSYFDGSNIRFAPYLSPFIEIDGDLVDIGPEHDTHINGIWCHINDKLIDSQGHETASAPSASTTYYAYVCSPRAGFGESGLSYAAVTTGQMRPQGPRLRLSATAPVSLPKWVNGKTNTYLPGSPPLIGLKYLGMTDRARCWRYVGLVRTSATPTFEDSVTQRFVANFHNRVRKSMVATDGTNSWTYTTATWRQANANTANKVEFVCHDDVVEFMVMCPVQNSGGATAASVGIGIDSTSADSSQLRSAYPSQAGVWIPSQAVYKGNLSDGYHYAAWLEYSVASGTTTWYGDNGNPTVTQSGIIGSVMV
ncbi:MAG TPA: hypothetical protein DEH78_14310, partial [Solibacterales bacterium]|nr:hypothetical protein [Bryobacterales bacterium]